jgi:alpha-ketoglutarate-dependent taurine dioxygenase
MGLEIRPLSDALGAEILGVDVNNLSDDAFRNIHQAHLDYCVIAIRDQHLTPEQHIAFSRRFGDLDYQVLDQYALAGHREILVLTNKVSDGKPAGLADAGRRWHTDMSYNEIPPLGSLLYGLEVPPEGGDTKFANLYAAYEALPDVTKKRVADLKGIHDYVRHYKRADDLSGGKRAKLTDEQVASLKQAVHPIVRTHPETGRKALYVDEGHSVGIEGMSDAEAKPLLKELYEHAIQPQFVYAHKWHRFDVVFWDNRCVLHQAQPYDAARYDRYMHRTTVKGDRPF